MTRTNTRNYIHADRGDMPAERQVTWRGCARDWITQGGLGNGEPFSDDQTSQLVRLMEETREIANIWDFVCHKNSKYRIGLDSFPSNPLEFEMRREVLEGYLNGILISVFSICILFLCPQYSGDPYQNDAGYQSVSNISDV